VHDAQDIGTRMIDAATARVADLIHCFNERQFPSAAGLFAADSIMEYAPLRSAAPGGQGFVDFAHLWTLAFPDAVFALSRVEPRGDHSFDAHLVATGTHTGPLSLGGWGTFKPSGAEARLHIRLLVEVKDAKVVYASVSLDLSDIVTQLVVVDIPKLLESLRRIEGLRERLASAPPDVRSRRLILDRLGAELDLARRTVRPYYDR
jgi:hypothetical protein